MSSNYVLGSHVEIFALSLYFGMLLFVALDKGHRQQSWAKYDMSQKQDDKLLFPSGNKITLPAGLSHIELCHVHNGHYDVPLSIDESLPKLRPYSSDASSSLTATIIT